MRSWLRAVVALVALGLPLAASGQRWFGSQGDLSNIDYNGRFTFTRIRYGGGGFFRGGSSWAHDYPQADRHLARILGDLTSIDPNQDRSNVFDLDDPEIFRYPIIYVSEPGFWHATDQDADRLRQYLLKGGFAIFDDFEGRQLYNLEAQLRRALPEYQPIEIGIEHPIFHSFFEMTNIYSPHPMVPVTPVYFGLFVDNDPGKRMLAIINHNNDLAEYWEWSDTGMFPVDFTNEAYKLGINYIVYGMTH